VLLVLQGAGLREGPRHRHSGVLSSSSRFSKSKEAQRMRIRRRWRGSVRGSGRCWRARQQLLPLHHHQHLDLLPLLETRAAPPAAAAAALLLPSVIPQMQNLELAHLQKQKQARLMAQQQLLRQGQRGLRVLPPAPARS
jgi:hypothetical protein